MDDVSELLTFLRDPSSGTRLSQNEYARDFGDRLWLADQSDTWKLERRQFYDETGFPSWDAFALVETHRPELRAYCYRMLGSVHDAEDAVQNAMLRAWRGLAAFQGRSSVRSWLYTIATNTTLDIARHRSRRELPADFGPVGPRHATSSGNPLSSRS